MTFKPNKMPTKPSQWLNCASKIIRSAMGERNVPLVQNEFVSDLSNYAAYSTTVVCHDGTQFRVYYCLYPERRQLSVHLSKSLKWFAYGCDESILLPDCYHFAWRLHKYADCEFTNEPSWDPIHGFINDLADELSSMIAMTRMDLVLMNAKAIIAANPGISLADVEADPVRFTSGVCDIVEDAIGAPFTRMSHSIFLANCLREYALHLLK